MNRPDAMPRWSGWAAAALALLVAVALPTTMATRTAAQGSGESLVVIIAPSSGITDLPVDVLRRAYLGLRAEHKGVRLIPLNAPPKTSIRERMDRALLGLEQVEVGRFWVNQRVRDGRVPPRTAPSIELALRVVAQLRGAIACVPTSKVSTYVTALRIDGKGPSDGGYLLAPR